MDHPNALFLGKNLIRLYPVAGFFCVALSPNHWIKHWARRFKYWGEAKELEDKRQVFIHPESTVHTFNSLFKFICNVRTWVTRHPNLRFTCEQKPCAPAKIVPPFSSLPLLVKPCPSPSAFMPQQRTFHTFHAGVVSKWEAGYTVELRGLPVSPLVTVGPAGLTFSF